MRAKPPNAAVNAVVARFRRVAGTITDRPVLASGFRPSEESFTLAFLPSRVPVWLMTTAGRRGPLLSMAHGFIIERGGDGSTGYNVRAVAYYYEYEVLDLQERELLAYHWHPVGASPITTHHFHLSGQVPPLSLGRGADPVALAEMHPPTGAVWLADFVRLLIPEFGVSPRRADWATILQQTPAVS